MYDGLEVDHKWAAEVAADLAALAEANRSELRTANREGRFPAELYAEMGRRGWVGPTTPVALGGLGGGVAEYCVIAEEVGRTGLVSPQISVQGQRWLADWGTPEQQERYLGPMARGELIFSESISEPGVGSSLKLMQATATPDGDDWILDGTKCHVNLGHQSDVTLLYAIAPEGLTAFLVDTDLPGFSSEQTEPIGLRLIPTADMHFDAVRVPSSAVLGGPGRGMDTFFSTFNISRLGNASELIGFGRRALAEAVAYGRDREVGDSVVTDFQGIRWTLADRYADLYGAALARNQAANRAVAGDDPGVATSLAKKMAIEASEAAVGEAYALVGGHGLYHDTDFGTLLLDAKVLRIAGGSLEVLRNHVARSILKADDLMGLA
jgi:alkylation response protein AidB-like acyl-CoA dehydrogenase